MLYFSHTVTLTSEKKFLISKAGDAECLGKFLDGPSIIWGAVCQRGYLILQCYPPTLLVTRQAQCIFTAQKSTGT